MSNFSLNLRTGFLISLLAELALIYLTLSEFFSALTGGILIAGLIYCYVFEYRSTIPVTPYKKNSRLYTGLAVGDLLYLLHTRFIFKTEFNDYLCGYLIAIVCLLSGLLISSQGFNVIMENRLGYLQQYLWHRQYPLPLLEQRR